MKTALITGAAHRIGAQISQTLHSNGYNVIIHYKNSKAAAEALSTQLNQIRKHSASTWQADLNDIKVLDNLNHSIDSLDLLVNNASVFYPTPIHTSTLEQWNDLINTNLTAPFFLATALAPKLKENSGCIINIVDIHSERPLKNHAIYNISKAGIAMMTKTLAKELAPNIRVCGVSPGSILWPENDAELSDIEKNKMLGKIALNKQGSPIDIANTVLFLANSSYITGQIIIVDGGRTLNQ